MGGGLMQLVAYGAQDIYLTSNPQITFFKVVYRRHTNFSREVIQQTFSGTAGQGRTINVTISRNGDLVHKLYLETPQSGTKTLDNYTYSNPGHSMIDFVELEIGGQTIDKIYGHWMEVWARLSQPNDLSVVGLCDKDNRTVYTSGSFVCGNVGRFYDPEAIDVIFSGGDTTGLFGDVDVTNFFAGSSGGIKQDLLGSVYQEDSGASYLQYYTGVDNVATNSASTTNSSLSIPNMVTRYQKLAGGGGLSLCGLSGVNNVNSQVIVPSLQVPLPFWFCKNPGLALPLIALQYHEVKLKIKFASNEGYFLSDSDDVKVWAEYIYLDTPERRRFAQGTHEYLIEQLQRFEGQSTTQDGTTVNATMDLNFNHPVKELIFTGGFLDNRTYGALPGIADSGTTVTLKLNGHDRFSAGRRWDYFSKTQIYEHHTGPGNLFSGGYEGVLTGVTASSTSVTGDLVDTCSVNKADQIGVYSFALKPEEHQPSGTCNFSRIDSTRLTFNNLVKESGSGSIQLTVYAVNYNVLRIMSGMGGLAYSN